MISINHLKYKKSKGAIHPYFFTNQNETAEVIELVNYYEMHLGKKFSEFSEEKIVEIVGDFKVAKSFQSVFSHFYLFVTILFEEAVVLPDVRDKENQKGEGTIKCSEIRSYSDLRLFIFSLSEKGFVQDHNEKQRVFEEANRKLNASIDFDSVLWLDHPDNRVLRKQKNFDIKEFISLYNSEVLHTLFINSSMVSFKLKGFDKKIFWACKRNGLLFDIVKNQDTFVLKVFGPIELFGKSTKYGYRIAKAVPKLMDYSDELTAFVNIKNKELIFSTTSDKYGLITAKQDVETTEEELAGDVFDSFPEQEFFTHFSHNRHGWQIQREPEPIIQKDVVVVPDFCIKRSNSKVFAEIVGFWTKEYQEKKLWKLSKLRDVNMIVIVSSRFEEESKKKFAELQHPVLYHDFRKPGLLVNAVLKVLEEKYSDFQDRFANVVSDYSVLEQINQAIKNKGNILTHELKDLFKTFTEDEFNKLLSSYEQKTSGVFVSNAGFFAPVKVDRLRDLFKKYENRSREELVNSMEPGLQSYVDALLAHLKYSTKWKSLEATEIIKEQE